jgi:2-methylisocitrate lyase-like PEP mutase family enzyme
MRLTPAFCSSATVSTLSDGDTRTLTGVGADVLYAPFPPDLDALVAIVTAVAPTPVNVLVSPSDKVLTVAELQKAGVKRISLGPLLYTQAMGALEQATKALVAGDLASATTGGMSFDRINELLARTPRFTGSSPTDRKKKAG